MLILVVMGKQYGLKFFLHCLTTYKGTKINEKVLTMSSPFMEVEIL